MQINEEEPSATDVYQLLLDHLADMRTHSPPESVHALDIDSLSGPDITFWTVRENDALLGCGALKTLDSTSAEIKSMKTAPAHQRKGVARFLIQHILAVAADRNLKLLLLETGTAEAFAPARKLYANHGFVECEPFADYKLDPYSVFMQRSIED